MLLRWPSFLTGSPISAEDFRSTVKVTSLLGSWSPRPFFPVIQLTLAKWGPGGSKHLLILQLLGPLCSWEHFKAFEMDLYTFPDLCLSTIVIAEVSREFLGLHGLGFLLTCNGIVGNYIDKCIPSKLHCLSQKKVAYLPFAKDRLLLWLRSAFAVALFRQPYAMSQHLFPSELHYIFGRDFVLMTEESSSFLQSFPLTPNTFNGVKVRPLVAMWCPIHVLKWLLILPDTHVSSCSTLSQLEPDESCHCCPGIRPSHQGRKKSIDGITW